jgi:quinol monooxygenase YgiN
MPWIVAEHFSDFKYSSKQPRVLFANNPERAQERSSMSTLVIIGSSKGKPGRADEVRPILKSLLLPTLAEEGCLRYEMNESEDGQSWVFTELWESRALWERHMKSEQVARFRAIAGDMTEYWHIFEGRIIRPGT